MVAIGTAPVEADGSFFVKAPADQPIRFALLDAKGAVVRQEHGWFWIRRGEQRYCVGCHTGPERASENRVPAVLLRTTTPVDLTGTSAAFEAGRQLKCYLVFLYLSSRFLCMPGSECAGSGRSDDECRADRLSEATGRSVIHDSI